MWREVGRGEISIEIQCDRKSTTGRVIQTFIPLSISMVISSTVRLTAKQLDDSLSSQLSVALMFFISHHYHLSPPSFKMDHAHVRVRKPYGYSTDAMCRYSIRAMNLKYNTEVVK